MKSHLSRCQRALARTAGVLAIGLACLTPQIAEAEISEGVTFSKSGAQRDCDFIQYRMKFYIDAWKPDAESPGLSLSFQDVLPKGLSWVSNTLDTNLTKGGAALTEIDISSGANPNDTLKIEDLKLPAVAQDVFLNVTGVARIDRSVFNHGDTVANQAFVGVSGPGGIIAVLMSNAAGVPDNGNPLSGEPFEITLDLADCEDIPPPPPAPPGGGAETGDGPCFVIEEGEVECGKEFAGTYTFKMPVGPEMGGRTIELDAVTPGVWVTPASQVVPAGGGVLEWTIHGAAPGMTVELAATGVDFAAGPAEGLGICCSQKIEIAIPEDLPCEDIPDGTPHIDVEKKANTGECVLALGGYACHYTITATNIGTAKHDGPLTIFEQVTNVNPVDINVTTPPWACVSVGAGKLRCDHPGITLEPGEATLIDVQVKIAGGDEPAGRKVENCAWWAETDGDAEGPKSCDFATLCVAGEPGCEDPVTEQKNPKIEISKKTDTPVCEFTEGGLIGTANCRWTITVTNNGEGDFEGPFTVFDDLSSAPDAVTFQPSPPWQCDWEPATGQSKCFHPNLSLPSGADTLITVDASYDLATTIQNGITSVKNCTGFSVGGDSRPETLDKCDTADLPTPGTDPKPDGKADLTIDKACDPGLAGAPVRCLISVTNNGNGLAQSPIQVSDRSVDLTGGAVIQIETVTPDGPEWMCGAVPAETLFCSLPADQLPPTATRTFEVTLSLGANQSFRNCARGTTRLGDVVTSFGQKCYEGGTEIVIEKTGEATVEPGQETTFELTITNLGTADFAGDVMIADVMGIDGVGAPTTEITSITPPLGCASEPTQLPFSCVTTTTLNAGESRTHLVTVVVPEEMPRDEGGFNCAAVLDPNTAGGANVAPGASTSNLPTGQGPVSCHLFEIVEETPQCQNGMVANEQGLCACPQGTRWNGRRCAGDPGKVTPPPVSCKLKPGQVRTSVGRCVCPQGTYLRGGRCEDIPPQECRLLPGQIRTQDGRCVCPEATRLRNGRCVPYEVCTLKPGQIRDRYGRCVCPDGEYLIRGICQQPERCELLPGQIRTPDGQCVCRRGLQEVRGQFGQVIGCRKLPELCELKPGMIRIDGQCICRRGLTPLYDHNKQIIRCVPDQPVCRDKDRMRPDGTCCPLGTSHIGQGQCRKPPTTCPDPKRRKPDGTCCPSGTHWGGQGSNQTSSVARCVPNETACPDPKRRKFDGSCCPVGTVHAGHNVCRKVTDPVECTIKGQIKVRGQCVCPSGQRVIDGACQRPPVECKVKGQTMVRGQCVCPSGQRVINGTCQRPPVECKIKGQTMVRGQCVCPSGQRVINGTCQRPPVECKIKGQVRSRGQCVCPSGQRVINGACQRQQQPESCKIKGQIRSRGQCVCPKGQRVVNGACQRPQQVSCKIKGQINVRGNCVCPKRQRVVNGACQRPQQVSCKIKGQINVRGNCVCPKGQRVINGACRSAGNGTTPPKRQQPGSNQNQQKKLQELLKKRPRQKQVN